MIPKFRAWDKEDESWIDIKSLGMMEGEITILEEWDDDLPYFIEDLGKTWELMQSTRLTDKNGKEIFEGDIVRTEHDNFSMDEVPPEYKPYVGFIKYVKTGYSIITKDTYHPCLSNIRITNIEVLGNIHEHSHLLDNGGQQQ